MNNRRQFMSVAALAAAGISITGLRGQTPGGPACPAEQDVYRVISRYGARESVTRLPGATATVAIKVRVRSHEAFADTFHGARGLPFDRIHAAGNMLHFQHEGMAFEIENLA